MSDNQDALRLADALEQQFPIGTAQHYLDGEAAAELRRLHALVEEDSILQRRQRDEIARLMALNAELVEALRKCDEAMTWELGGEPSDTLMMDARNVARAALAKVEASK